MNPAERGVAALGEFIKSQRRLAELSQRELARLADLSDAYLSQLERGLHEPSVRVLNGLSSALNVPADKLLGFLGRSEGDGSVVLTTEQAILTDAGLSDVQKQSLVDVYRTFVAANAAAGERNAAATGVAATSGDAQAAASSDAS